uniref:ABC transporter G family member 51 n=1 Tax=Oryza sativa subsp. japonica TaxID=39947 RepID=AB51G_ORYSJ|nr:RecName: Full=ABC transporter G family member 51; Short=OsABCG51; AltName: Full=Pleiotropic drug resistance protein 13; Short=OsPDR13 [Oryza sativa Japonica Group]AAM18755.1 putatputative ABC transporter [Oryza sativa Japonica Group]
MAFAAGGIDHHVAVDVEGEEESRRRAVAEEADLLWAAFERLPSAKRRSHAVVLPDPDGLGGGDGGGRGEGQLVDVRKLDRPGLQRVLRHALATSELDNANLLHGIKARFDAVGLEVPRVEVRFQNLTVSTDVHVGRRALPTLVNYVHDIAERILISSHLLRPDKHKLVILDDVSGVIKPGRMTLLLGPPASGKSTLLLALADKLDSQLKKSGEVAYNGMALDQFCVQRTSAYISQTDNHIGELTVRETLDFAAKCQGASENWQECLKELVNLEKERGIRPSPEIDAFMKTASFRREKHNLVSDYVLRVLGLDICADTPVGSDMERGVSGGQKKRVTTGEMIIGPRKTLLMDEISTGLDSSTTFQIVNCMRNFVHEMEATVLMSLLQPAPETFELFDDLILLSEGKIIYQGPIKHVVDYFKSLGFSLPPRKGIADFLQEVTSKKDQAQYWSDQSKQHIFVSASEMAAVFKESQYGTYLEANLSSSCGNKDSALVLPRSKFAVPKFSLVRACFARELILISRNRFLYTFRTCQVAFVGIITSTLFLRTRLHPVDEQNGNLYLACLFFGLVHMMFNGFTEMTMTISRLPVFYKQRDNFFHPAWAFSLPNWILRIPYSFIEAVVWSCVVYYTVGFAPTVDRFFRFMLLLFSIHQMALGLFRMMGAIARDMTIASTFGSAVLLAIFLLGGFVVPKGFIKPWWDWAYWISPLMYAQRAVSVNEFSASRWSKVSVSGNMTVGTNILISHSLPTDDHWFWIGVGVLLAYSIFFNIMFTLALAFLNPLRKPQSMVPSDAGDGRDVHINTDSNKNTIGEIFENNDGFEGQTECKSKKGMILPFQPLTMTFHNVNYYVNMPKEMQAKGVPEKRLQLLSEVSGIFRPRVLTALVGASGSGKTTLMDVLAGRKTGGYIEGDIRISGHKKEQRTFARIAGYVEQNDIHSPQVTVEESLWFSSTLRLPNDISRETRHAFVEEVMALVELDQIRYALVGKQGLTGLSTEQRKRLTIAVELVANPSIIFMDEPTSGLDARAAAIVMRTVRNTVDTGRTVVCTIHQPSIDIFEAFDELLLMKRGGRVIYGGSLGVNSVDMINYFQGIPRVVPITEGYNPATWMLEVTTQASEERLGIDFATVYKNSYQFRNVENLIVELSIPASGTEPLKFSSEFSQNRLTQFMVCLRKQSLVYWRSPEYNVVRLFFTSVAAIIFGSIFWNVGMKRESTEDILLLMGALYAACLFLGVNNASSVQPVVSVERTVYYRERAANMYSSFPYAAAQVYHGLVEIPYIAVQTLIFGLITYFMVNYERNIRKLVLYLIYMFLTFTYFTFYGMVAVGLTPTQHMASVVSSAFYSLWNLLSGFLIPQSRIPGWWIWFYYICPVAWTLRGVITSQLGDVDTRIVGPGFDGTVHEFLQQNLGFEQGMTGATVAVLVAFSVFFFSIYAISIKMINFQRS